MIYLYVLGLLVLVLASIFDFRSREVPDTLSYSFIACVIALRILFSLKFGFSFLVEGFAGMLVLAAFSLILFYSGQWGGGDVKLLIGIGGLLGLKLSLFNPIIVFLACVAVAGAVYGIAFIVVLALTHLADFKRNFSHHLKKRIFLFMFSLALSVVSIFALLQTEDPLMISASVMLAVLPVLLAIFIASKSLESICFRKTVSVDELTEGDWLTKPIEVEGFKFKAKKEGLYKKDIEKLKGLKRKGLLESVEIRTGMPFVPVFLFAFILFLLVEFSGVLVLLC